MAAAFKETEMEAAKVCFVPRRLFMKHATAIARIAVAKPYRPTMQALGRVALPFFDRIEIVELRHTSAWRREMSGGGATLLVKFRHVKNVSENHPVLIESARKDFLAQASEPFRFIDLITVHAEYPCARSGEVSDEIVGLGRMPHRVKMNIGLDTGEPAQDGARLIGGAMIRNVKLVTEDRGIRHRGLNEKVLVTDERNPDDACSAQSSCLP
jgi:hypothetical protein